ncbi:MAG: AmmeMemoRadiSam system protein B [Acidobacteriota bacterium]
MIRYPSVAGTFYPGHKDTLKKEVEGMIEQKEKKTDVIGLISPHAGYIYSGSCAGKGFGSINIPDRIVILGVNHRGEGYPMAIDGNDKWATPLGDIEVDDDLRKRLSENSEVFGIDSVPAAEEHSLEVQVPFIQVLNPDARILPITIGTNNRDMMKNGGEELGALLAGIQDDILMVASTDMSHYISSEEAEKLDSLAIDAIKVMNPDQLYETVYSNGISMCGVAPTYIMMTAAGELGAKAGKVIQYTNSGETSGDFEHVVGYLSAIIN